MPLTAQRKFSVLLLPVLGREGWAAREQPGEQLGLGMDAEAAVDGGQVVAHRALAEEQVPGDHGDALAPQQAAQDIELALGQLAEGGIAPPHLAGGGAVAGALAGWGLSLTLVKILTGVFDPPPESLAVPWGGLGGLAVVIALAALGAGAASLAASRRPLTELIRDL